MFGKMLLKTTYKNYILLKTISYITLSTPAIGTSSELLVVQNNGTGSWHTVNMARRALKRV